jgi:hypothetical protein
MLEEVRRRVAAGGGESEGNNESDVERDVRSTWLLAGLKTTAD